MAGLGLVGLTDVARSFGPDIHAATPLSIAAWLRREWLLRRGGGFNYNPVLYAAIRVMKREWDYDRALKHVLNSGPEYGRASNRAVLDAIIGFLEAHEGQVHELKYAAAVVGKHRGRDIHIGIKAPAVRVQDGVPLIFYPGFRKTFRSSEEQTLLECSIVCEILAQNDFYGAGLEYVSARSTGRGLERICVVRSASEMPLLDKTTIDLLLSKYVRAVGLLWDEGLGLRAPLLGGYHVINPDQGDLF
jgi:hypothetical protein